MDASRSANSIIAIVVIAIIASILIGAISGFVGILDHEVTTSPGQLSNVTEASYIIYKDGDYTCAKNGTTGRIIERSENASKVISDALELGGRVFVRSGTYEITFPIIPQSNTHIIGEPGSIIYGSDDGDYIFTNRPQYSGVPSSFGTPVALINDAIKYSQTVEMITTGLSAGDWLQLYADVEFEESDKNISQLVQIASVAVSSVELTYPISFPFNTADNATATPVDMMENITIESLSFKGISDISNQIGLRVEYANNVKVLNCNFQNIGYSSLDLIGVINGVVSGCSFDGSHITGTGYGIALSSNTAFVKVVDCNFQNCRHGSTTGEEGVVQHIDYINCEFLNTDSETPHKNSQFVTYSDCRFYGSHRIWINVPYTTVSGCTFDSVNYQDSLTLTHAMALVIGWDSGTSIGHNATIRDNIFMVSTMDHNKDAIVIWTGENVTISGNRIVSVGPNACVGIKIHSELTAGVLFSNNNLAIEDNYISVGGVGILAGNSHTYPIYGLKITGNRIESTGQGISGYPCNAIISNNHIISKNYGVLIYERGNLISNNYIESQHATYYALYLTFYADGNSIIGNKLVNKAGYGLYVLGTSGDLIENLIISNNQIYSDYGGASIQYCNRLTVSSNFVDNVSFAGLFTKNSQNITFSANIIQNKAVGADAANTLRIVIDGVGINGENDPNSAGQWKGYGYEGLFVKWNAGTTHYLSVYRGGAWYDWVIA